MTLRAAEPKDEGFVWQVNNEPSTRRVSVDPRPIELSGHSTWFSASLANTQRSLLIAENAGDRVGVVRLDHNAETACTELSLALLPAARGKGLGARLIELATGRARGRVLCHIRPDNAASLRAFEKVGFAVCGRAERRGVQLVVMEHKMQQRDVFAAGEADAWFARNREVLGQGEDPVLRELADLDLAGTRVLEIGCSNGWRLHALAQRGAVGFGLEPSGAAVTDGRAAYPGLDLRVGTADALPFADEAFELVLFGFCLYLCDPCDLFTIAAEAVRVLKPSSHLAIYDFCPASPMRNAYHHRPGCFSHKMDYANMFEWHPGFTRIRHRVSPHSAGESLDDSDARIAVTLLRRGPAGSW